MTPRRKLPPSPIATHGSTGSLRPLRAVRDRSGASRLLPTAAALALALGAIGCGTRLDDARPDPAAIRAPVVSAPVPTTTTAPGTNAIDPEPHAIAGEPAMVVPVPSSVPSSVPTPAKAHVTPRHRVPRTAGVPPRVTHDPPF